MGQASAPQLVDLSEGGDVFRFDQEADGTVTVYAEETRRGEVLVFEVRDAHPGRPLQFELVSDIAELEPAIRTARGPWSAVPLAEDSQLHITAPEQRFLVRLKESPKDATEAAYYTYTDFTNYMSGILTDPLAQVTQIGTSVQGRPLYRILIDDPIYPAAGKKTFVMMVRQHGDEWGCSYLLEGTLDLLLGRNGLVPPPDLRRNVRWIIYPMMNPDGAVLNQRWNVNFVDLNRDWESGGCNAGLQEAETFAHQCDLETLATQYDIVGAGDHHGWSTSTHGGFRYSNGAAPSSVSTAEYQEARDDTEVIAEYDPTQTDWIENGGQTGMFRVEMYQLLGALIHTPEYDGNLSTDSEFYSKGQEYAHAVEDFLHSVELTDAQGGARCQVRIPSDGIHVTVDDGDENQNPGVAETVQVEVMDSATGDKETLVLTETGPDTSLFRNTTALSVAPDSGSSLSGDGTLEAASGSTIQATYTDDDYPADSDQDQDEVFSLATAPDLEFAMDPGTISPGDTLTFEACQGQPGNPAFLFLSEVNGSPSFTPLQLLFLDSNGNLNIPLNFPATTGLAGNNFGFLFFTKNALNKAVASNQDVVVFP